jgi:hypothetical protein
LGSTCAPCQHPRIQGSHHDVRAVAPGAQTLPLLLCSPRLLRCGLACFLGDQKILGLLAHRGANRIGDRGRIAPAPDPQPRRTRARAAPAAPRCGGGQHRARLRHRMDGERYRACRPAGSRDEKPPTLTPSLWFLRPRLHAGAAGAAAALLLRLAPPARVRDAPRAQPEASIPPLLLGRDIHAMQTETRIERAVVDVLASLVSAWSTEARAAIADRQEGGRKLKGRLHGSEWLSAYWAIGRSRAQRPLVNFSALKKGHQREGASLGMLCYFPMLGAVCNNS